ncbi:MAG: YhgE/Pip domain-containing protein [Bifidobacteriaceae bacterium]|jgi:putative membrane protein|nr:YhgE/Pip domain-containing protein [Bifidobacteriaceae bacterium]
MKNTWKLFSHDIRKAVSNIVGVILVLGLTLIPALFTWFNIAASWDPFSNTKNITFAIANTDKGYKSDLVPLKINVGEQVVSTLRANNQLDWVFTNQDDAVDGTKSGKYYAAVVIPSSFSKDMMTFFDANAKHSKLTYYTNEKKNALAPKITGQGAGEVSTQINEIFTETISDVALNLVSSLSKYLDEPDTKALVSNLDERVQLISKQLRTAGSSTTVYTTALDSAMSLADSSAALIGGTTNGTADAKKTISSALTSADSIKKTLDAASGSLSTAMDQSKTSYADVAKKTTSLFDSAGTLSADSSKTLTAMAKKVSEHIASYKTLLAKVQAVQDLLPTDGILSLQGLISSLNDTIETQGRLHDALIDAAAKITAAAKTTASDRTKIEKLTQDAVESVASLKTSYDSTLQPELAKLSTKISTTTADASTVMNNLGSSVNDLSNSNGSVDQKLTTAKDAVSDLSTTLKDAASKLDTLHKNLQDALTSGDISELKKVIGSNPDGLAAAVAAPVGVTRIPVFPVENFGSSMAPLYMIIALWVGALLMCVSIRTEVSRSTLMRLKGIKLRQIYLGRFGIFAVISLLQSTFECLGCILFLKVQAVHPFLFILTGWAAGLVFTFMIYTLVVSFGNAGKAVGVLFLVVQISGAGGAYPLQVLPKFFQNISPFLPATHAINAVRSAIAGIYQNDYWISLGYLALFLVPTLLLGLVLRKPVISFNRKFVAATEKTRLL